MAWIEKTLNLVLWTIYRRGEWWSRIFGKRITRLGWFVFILSVISGVFGTDVNHNAFGFIFFLGFICIGVEFISLFFRRAKVWINYTGTSNKVAYVGQRVSLPFKLTAKSKLHRVAFTLYPWVPITDFKTFHENKEPREEQRNIFDRVFKFYRWRWLENSTKKAFTPVSSEMQWLNKADASEGVSLTFPVTFEHRGKWPLINVRAQLPGTFGLLQRSLKTNGERGDIYVSPKILPVRVTATGGNEQEDSLSLTTSSKVGDSHEFHSLREYRVGDSWRKVNWKAMARTEKLMIQDSEEPGVPSYAVIFKSEGCDHASFETALSVVASIVTHLSESSINGALKIHHGTCRTYSWDIDKDALFRALAEISIDTPWTEEEDTPGELYSSGYLIHAKGAQLNADELLLSAILIEGEKVNNSLNPKELIISP